MHLGHRYGPRWYLPERCAARVPPHQPPWSPARPPLPSSGCRRPALGHRGEAEPLASGRSQLGSALCQRVGARSTAPRPPEAAAQRGCRPDPDNRLRDRDAGSYTAMDMFGPCRTAARPVAMIVCPGSMPPPPLRADLRAMAAMAQEQASMHAQATPRSPLGGVEALGGAGAEAVPYTLDTAVTCRPREPFCPRPSLSVKVMEVNLTPGPEAPRLDCLEDP